MDESRLWQRLAAEFLGTAFLVFVGVGSVPALAAARGTAPFTGSELGFISLSFATIVIVTAYVFGYVSGNHINPAVTVGFAAVGKFPWKEVPHYIVAQVAGAIVGSLGIVGVLGNTAVKGGLGVAAFNPEVTTVPQALLAEFLGTFILVYAVFGAVFRKGGRHPAEAFGHEVESISSRVSRSRSAMSSGARSTAARRLTRAASSGPSSLMSQTSAVPSSVLHRSRRESSPAPGVLPRLAPTNRRSGVSPPGSGRRSRRLRPSLVAERRGDAQRLRNPAATEW